MSKMLLAILILPALVSVGIAQTPVAVNVASASCATAPVFDIFSLDERDVVGPQLSPQTSMSACCDKKNCSQYCCTFTTGGCGCFPVPCPSAVYIAQNATDQLKNTNKDSQRAATGTKTDAKASGQARGGFDSRPTSPPEVKGSTKTVNAQDVAKQENKKQAAADRDTAKKVHLDSGKVPPPSK